MTLCSATSLLGGAPALVIDPRSSRGEIRGELFKQTPINSSAADVMKFISKNLPDGTNSEVALVDGAAPVNTKQRGVKFIRLYLGHYYDHPEVVFFAAPLMSQREVSAIWIFDRKDRLIDIVVDKHTGVY